MKKSAKSILFSIFSYCGVYSILLLCNFAFASSNSVLCKNYFLTTEFLNFLTAQEDEALTQLAFHYAKISAQQGNPKVSDSSAVKLHINQQLQNLVKNLNDRGFRESLKFVKSLFLERTLQAWDEMNLIFINKVMLAKKNHLKTQTQIQAILIKYDVTNINDALLKSCKAQASISTSQDLQEVIVLLESGADINAQWNTTQETALLLASKNNNLELVELLLNWKANVQIPDRDLATPLHYTGNHHIAELLLDAGANVDSESKDGITPVMFASWQKKKFQVLQVLIKHGANLNKKTKKGRTALIGAVENIATESVRLLLENNADFRIRDSDLNRAIDYARDYAREEAASKENLAILKKAQRWSVWHRFINIFYWCWHQLDEL